MLSIVQLAYLVSVRPFDARLTQMTEVFNESCVLINSYTLVGFTDFAVSPDARSLFGYVLIGTIVLNFAVNISV